MLSIIKSPGGGGVGFQSVWSRKVQYPPGARQPVECACRRSWPEWRQTGRAGLQGDAPGPERGAQSSGKKPPPRPDDPSRPPPLRAALPWLPEQLPERQAPPAAPRDPLQPADTTHQALFVCHDGKPSGLPYNENLLLLLLLARGGKKGGGGEEGCALMMV